MSKLSTITKNRLRNFLPPVWARLVVLLALAVAVFGASGLVFAASTSEPTADNSKLVTIYDNGSERTIVTKASTIRAALTEANVTVEPIDAVEPSLDTKLVAENYNVNVYRARPVVVVDGGQKTRVMTAAQDPSKIAADAGVSLYPEDITKLSRIDDVLAEGGAGLMMTITRSTPVNLVLYGSPTSIRTQATNVGDLLAEKKIQLAPNDSLSVSADTPITKNMRIEIWRNGKQTITKVESVPYKTETVKDADQEVGYKKVQTKGIKGKKTVTYEIEMKNGREVGRKKISTVTTKEAKNEVVVVGTKAKTLEYNGGGTKNDWLKASGIPESEWGYVDYIVTRESGWNPNAVNASSGACGLGQQLPCGKWAGQWNDPVAALRAMDGYVSKFGGWAGAYNYWQANGNY